MRYISKDEIANRVRERMSKYGSVNPSTPIYELIEGISDEMQRLFNEVYNEFSEKVGSADLASMRSDIEMIKTRRADAHEVAQELWKMLQKKHDGEKANFIEELEKI